MEKKVKDKKKRDIYYAKTSEQKEMGNFLVVIIVVLVCVGGIYFFTRAFVTKDLFKKDTPRESVVEPGKIDYEVAIMGTIMNRADEEYYVVIYDSTSSYAFDMNKLVSNYTKAEKHLPVYVVDLSNKTMNGDGKYYDPNNISENPTSLEDLKVGDRTVIKIKKGKIDKFIPDMIQKKDKDGKITLSSNYEAIEKELTVASSSKK